MNPGFCRRIIAATGLLWTASSLALQPQVVDEVRTLLHRQALILPDESQMRTLDTENLDAALKRIDPWAAWVAADFGADMPEPAGIGAELYTALGGFWLMPYVGGSLFRSGIADRVELRAVNGSSVAGMSLSEVGRALTGTEGEVVELDLCVADCRSPQTLSMVLEPLRRPSVERVEIAGQPLFRLRQFVGRETKVFLRTLLAAESGEAPLILDLRDCQGVDLFEAMDSAALFIPPHHTLAMTYDRVGLQQRYTSPQEEKFANPLAILIGNNTASAGEVFAGILQARGRAILVGSKSRGKCVSQTESVLSDGSLLRFTNLEVVLPDGRHCNEQGLTPDITVTAQEALSSILILERLRHEGQIPAKSFAEPPRRRENKKDSGPKL